MGSVIEREVLVLQLHRTTNTLCLFFNLFLALFALAQKASKKGTYNRIPIVIHLSCQFKMHSTKNRLFFFMDFHASSNFGNDVYKMSSFEGRVMHRGFGATRFLKRQNPRFLVDYAFYSLAMHGITLPHHWMIRSQHGINMLGQELIDFGGTVSPDKRHLARDLVGINN